MTTRILAPIATARFAATAPPKPSGANGSTWSRTLRAALLAVPLLAAPALLSPVLPAPLQDVGVARAAERDVRANRTTELAFLNVYNTHGCRYGARPKVELRQPRHGRITTRWMRRPITSNVFGRGGDKCVGRDMYGLAVYYTPRRGYRGPDSYYLRWTYRTAGGYRGFLGGREQLRVR